MGASNGQEEVIFFSHTRGLHACSAALLAVVLTFAATPAAAHLGSPDLEPALVGRSDIIFFEDFEQANYYTHWGQSSAPSTVSRVASPLFDGDWSLRVRVPAGQHTGIGWQWKFRNFGLPEPEEIYFRYYVYAADTWDLAANGQVGKWPGIAGTYGVAGWGGRPSHGDDGWSARMSNYDRGSVIEPAFYCYHADMTGIYGSNWTWGSDAYLNRNAWHAVEVYGKMNSITGGAGNNDGILRGWVDGQLVFEKTDIRFRDVTNLKIECIWFNVYVGGTWTAEQNMDLYFDNMVFASSYIGPMPGLGDANSDGAVDGADYTAWADHYKLPGHWAEGDFNSDGIVDGADYTVWADHFTGGAAVPEPATLALLACAALAALRPCRR